MTKINFPQGPTGGDMMDIADGAIIQRNNKKLVCGGFRAGSAAGWVVSGINNLAATLAASQTAATLVIPLSGVYKENDIITGFTIVAQIESGGNTCTLDADLRKMTNAAADPVDASVGAITQVSVIADTKSQASKTGLSEVVMIDESFYLLVTATTAAATDIQFLGVYVHIQEQ